MDRDMRRNTAWDVAERAGVSQSTVSRVFTGSTRISQTTRERVLAAARELDYLPDKRASRLRSGQTGIIAVVVIIRAEDSAREVNPFAYALLGSVCRAASESGYETMVSFQASPDQFYGRYVEQRDSDALVVIGTTQNAAAWEYYRPLLEPGRNAVCWGLPLDNVPSVRSDNYAGGRLAAEHLWQQGYRRPAFLGPLASAQRQFHERYQGFVEALGELGGTTLTVPELDAKSRVEQGREAIRLLLAKGEAFDSVFAACDFIALGALEALAQAGKRVPQEIGVVGYDGIDAAAHAHPPLTTIKPDLEKAGRLMVAQVLGNEDAEQAALAPVELIARTSTHRV